MSWPPSSRRHRAPRILLFDWHEGGHHSLYARRIAEHLPVPELAIAMPDSALTELVDVDAEKIPLGTARPARAGRREAYALARAEIALVRETIAAAEADHLVHLYSDPAMEELARAATLPVPVTTTVFYPRAHYPGTYQTALTPRERIRAWRLERAVERWRRREDAHAVFALDEEVVRIWNRRELRAPAYWLPEPPVVSPPVATRQRRSGCVLYGALAARKGVDRLASAVELMPPGFRVMLAGPVDPFFESELHELVARMQTAGAQVELAAHPHTEAEGLATLAGAACAVLPYHRHCGMSRVLVEAASVGTPVVVDDHGLIGRLSRTYGLGAVVDSTHSASLAAALTSLGEPEAALHHADALARFASRYAPRSFAAAVSSPFGGTEQFVRPQRRIAEA